jgi:Cft2 family RNA processing exonuclease
VIDALVAHLTPAECLNRAESILRDLDSYGHSPTSQTADSYTAQVYIELARAKAAIDA